MKKTADDIIDKLDEKHGEDNYSILDVVNFTMKELLPEWIKIESESDLPNHTNDVLILVENQPLQAFYISGKWVGSHELRAYVDDGWDGNFTITNQDMVTHWMPLPSCPI